MKRMIFATCMAAVLVCLATAGFNSRKAQAKKPNANRIEPRGQFVAGRVLVKFHDNILPDQARNMIAALGARDADEIPHIGVHILDLPYQASETAFAQAFQARPEVEFAELDRLLSVQQMIPNDPLYASDTNLNAWSLPKIGGPAAWDITTGDPSIIIAILDTGIDSLHEDLAAKIVAGRNIVANNTDVTDVYGHGTMVAGQAAAISNNGIGVASVAWGCLIMPVKISADDGIAAFSDIASGLTWAADQGARVANVSYKVTGSSTVSRAAKYFQGKGGVVTTAAGNSGSFNSVQDDPYILTVGATDQSDVLFSWSDYGNNQDLVAPGTVYTTHRGGGYTVGTGTSASAPQVAGAAALVLSVNPSLTGAQVQQVLKDSADDLGSPGWDSQYGYGRLNLARAVNMAATIANPTTDSTPPVDTIIAPTQGQNVSNNVSVLVSTTDNVGVVKVELYVDGVLYGSSSTAPFTIKWATRKVGAGMHTLKSKAYDGAGNVGVSTDLTVYK
jgi:thermitase